MQKIKIFLLNSRDLLYRYFLRFRRQIQWCCWSWKYKITDTCSIPLLGRCYQVHYWPVVEIVFFICKWRCKFLLHEYLFCMYPSMQLDTASNNIPIPRNIHLMKGLRTPEMATINLAQFTNNQLSKLLTLTYFPLFIL